MVLGPEVYVKPPSPLVLPPWTSHWSSTRADACPHLSCRDTRRHQLVRDSAEGEKEEALTSVLLSGPTHLRPTSSGRRPQGQQRPSAACSAVAVGHCSFFSPWFRLLYSLPSEVDSVQPPPSLPSSLLCVYSILPLVYFLFLLPFSSFSFLRLCVVSCCRR